MSVTPQHIPTNLSMATSGSDVTAPILLLPELACEHILSYLNNDKQNLFNLRQVCKKTNSWVSLCSVKVWENYQIKFEDESWKTFDSFLATGLKISDFWIDNRSLDIYRNRYIWDFLEAYGARRIRKLKVGYFNGCLSAEETRFYDSLTNLEELEIDLISSDSPLESLSPTFPKTFKNLKVLKLNRISSLPGKASVFYWHFFRFCPKLEVLKRPLEVGGIEVVEEPNGTFLPFLCHILDIVISRENEPDAVPVRCIDMANFIFDPNYEMVWSWSFLHITELCTRRNIILINVDSYLLATVSLIFPELPDEVLDFFDKTMYSLVNLNDVVQKLSLTNLEKLAINSMRESEVDQTYEYQPQWPNLKTIEINFDRDTRLAQERDEVIHVVDFLFTEISGDSVEELSVDFIKRPPLAAINGRNGGGGASGYLTDADCLQSFNIVNQFPNLKKLKIVGWNAKNCTFLLLWKKLGQLEELWIEDCQILGNVGFIGTKRDTPVFLLLTGLKKLTLKLDTMPKVTDRCFHFVFRHMKLQQFHLLSDSPLKSVTAAGIKSLSEGEFADSVKKFPFGTFNLKDVTPARFSELKHLFRCNQ